MSFYDIFFKKKHPIWAQDLLISLNKNCIDYLLLKIKKEHISILEIGPGKGYFYKAIQSYGGRFKYSAMDRNKLMLDKLRIRSTFVKDAPKFPHFSHKFDIIYAAFVIEHLDNGKAIADLIQNCKKSVNKGGLIVFLAPDCMKLNMEFWNIDYTHIFPTTKRNVAMAFKENELDTKIIDISGLLTHRFFANKFVYRLWRFVIFFYNYRLMNSLFSVIYKKNVYELDNIFYQFYCLAKEENMMIVAKV